MWLCAFKKTDSNNKGRFESYNICILDLRNIIYNYI